MLFLILVVILFVQFLYGQEKSHKEKSLWLRHRKTIILFSMMLIPIGAMNLFLPKTYLSSSEELINYGEENENFAYTKLGYEEQFLVEPQNVLIRFEYVDLYNTHGTSDCEFLAFDLIFFDKKTEALTLAYIELKCKKQLSNDLAIQLKAFKNNVPFKNYLLGYQAYLLNDSSCTEYFLKDIAVNPNYSNSYNLVANYYYRNNKTEQLYAFISNPAYRSKIDVQFREFYHFMNGNWTEYTWTIIDSRLRNISFIAMFAALMISLAWGYFLYRLDVYNPEKWYHLAIVFALGMLFSFLALPLYDIAYYYFEFKLNGTFLNDFLYSFLVIGGSEELVKFLPWFFFAFFTKRLKEPYDYLIYASIAALGFAFAENWMYLENTSSIVKRGLISTVSHMFDASVIAYSLILFRFKYASKKWKWLLPIAGFTLAAFSHGFYDFWLISIWSKEYSFMTIFFFIFSLHIWFYFKNNALNHSSFYKSNIQLNLLSIQENMTFVLVGLLMVEYVIFSSQYGAIQGNNLIYNNIPFVAFFIIYFNYQINTLKVQHGSWSRFKLHFPRILSSFRLKRSNRNNSNEMPSSGLRMEVIGKSFTFYTPKTNKYIGNQLPISGTVTHQLTVDGDNNWYILHLHKDLVYSNYEPHCAIFRVADSNRSIFEDKVEVLFLLVTSINNLKNENLKSRDFRYTGKVYSRLNNR